MELPLVNPERCHFNVDSDLHQAKTSLEQNNFTVVRALYAKHHVAELVNLVSPYLYAFDSDRSSNTFKPLDNHGRIKEVANLTKLNREFKESEIYQRSFAFACSLFNSDCHYGFDHAIFKKPGSGPVKWHQDQFYSKADLAKECLSFWIPLQNVSSHEGGMEYATNISELLPHTPIAPNSRTYHIDKTAFPTTKTVSPKLNRGDVCIHTPLSLHRSYPNNSNATRSAWIIQFNRYGITRFFKWRNIKNHIHKIA